MNTSRHQLSSMVMNEGGAGRYGVSQIFGIIMLNTGYIRLPQTGYSTNEIYLGVKWHTESGHLNRGDMLKWHTEFGHLNRGDMLTSEQHRCSNEKKK
ncbi:hypothetical protein, partial [Escherichia coli]|uniref:hypothetical protein n=3 Tax=Escherichia coli TaxID=562 RepID=UPI001BC8A346